MVGAPGAAVGYGSGTEDRKKAGDAEGSVDGLGSWGWGSGI
jgi:hypothetical protein